MTIARDFASEPGFYGDEAGVVRWWDGARWTPAVGEDSSTPFSIRSERLDAQIRSFERAGYRLETRSGLQAVVVRPVGPRPVRRALVAVATLGTSLLPELLGARRGFHRVVITVDGAGAVRLA